MFMVDFKALCLAVLVTTSSFLVLGCGTDSGQRLRAPRILGGSDSTQPELAAYEVGLPDLTSNSSVEDYLAYAALANPGLRADFERWQSALHRVPEAESFPDPKVSYAYFIRSIETRVGPMEQRVVVSQTFPYYGKRRLRGSAAAEAANAALDRYEAARLLLFFRVQDSYYELYYLKHALKVIDTTLELLRSLEQTVRTRYTVGDARNADLLKLQMELGKVDNERASLADRRGAIEAKLNSSLNRELADPLPWPAEPSLATEKLDERQLLQRLTDENPELRALKAHIEKAQIEVELAEREYLPDFTVGLDYTEIGDARTPSTTEMTIPSSTITVPAANPADPPQQIVIPSRMMRMQMPAPRDSGKDALAVMVSFDLPVWHGRLKAGTAEAESRLRASRELRIEKENSLKADLKLALYRFRDAQRQVSLYGDTLIPSAEQALRASQTSYIGGAASFAHLIDAERLLLEFKLGYYRAVASKMQSLARIEMLVGRRFSLASASSKRVAENVFPKETVQSEE